MSDDMEIAKLVAAAGLGGTALGIVGNYLVDLGRTKRDRSAAKETRRREALYALQDLLDASRSTPIAEAQSLHKTLTGARTQLVRIDDRVLTEATELLMDRIWFVYEEMRNLAASGGHVPYAATPEGLSELHDAANERIRYLLHSS